MIPSLLVPGSRAAVLELAVGWGNWEGPESWGTGNWGGGGLSLLPSPFNFQRLGIRFTQVPPATAAEGW